MMLRTKYQGSSPLGFRQEEFFMVYVKHMTPLWRGRFGCLGDNLNKLGKGPLGDATYQISKL